VIWVADLLRVLLAPFDSWSTHQLEVLRTIAIAIGSGLVPVFGLAITLYARLIRRDTKAARANTVTEDWGSGVLVEVPVAETARAAAHLAQHAADVAKTTGEATRQEVSDLAGWVRGPGRRRQATSEIPRLEE
jgi:nitrate reductase gamma subunit